MDLTIAEIIMQLPTDDPVKAWWESVPEMPSLTTVSEFFVKTLKAANDAQRTKNATLAAGSRIAGYPSPTNGTVTVDAATGIQSFLTTYSVTARVAINLDVAISPLA
jgi:hypothetical protein